ncbi:hypothetical protein [Mesorhizobium sp. L48C026A00]|uniref:hypothetical protein n=1 Tax=Mesorhizobium sp. L48C026A00 TaxID=1287182 RepID=UPI0003CF9F23|nr:hypothetical protein [Mesorhizobium sp. L48C026A00]ESZ12270.1 hypothetical protein X737_28090 [Mesorhizobium sp. L48C026A00]
MQQNRNPERSTGGNLPENINGVLDGALVNPVLCLRIHPIIGEPKVSSGHADPFGMGIAAALVQRSTGAPR